MMATTTTTRTVPAFKPVAAEPPKQERPRTPSIPAAVLSGFAKSLLDSEGWTGGGVEFKTKQHASNASQVLRKHVARTLGVDGKRVRSRVWDEAGKGDVKNGKWVFALTLKPAPVESAAATTESLAA
jgi:hypothetical protein